MIKATPNDYEEGATSYDCVAVYDGVRCNGEAHLQDNLFTCDTCSYSWDIDGLPLGRAK